MSFYIHLQERSHATVDKPDEQFTIKQAIYEYNKRFESRQKEFSMGRSGIRKLIYSHSVCVRLNYVLVYQHLYLNYLDSSDLV